MSIDRDALDLSTKVVSNSGVGFCGGRVRLVAAMVIAAVVSGCSAAGPAASPSTGAAPTAGVSSAVPASPVTEQFTPVVIRVMSQPRWFTGTDAKVHLVYELELTNGFPVPVTVTGVTVRDAAGGSLQNLTGEVLAGAMSPLAGQSKRPTVVEASAVRAVWMDITMAGGSQLPSAIEHTLTVSVPPGLPVPSVISSTGGATEIDRRPPTVIGPPLDGTGWIALPSCCDGPHRRSLQPINNSLWLAQRFAIDFNKIDAKGLLASGDSSRNAAWFTYDQPVLAVADARVVAAVDGYPDQVPDAPKPVGIEEADGNHVILELSAGVYAFYAHLKPGSVSVRAGDQVVKGQPLGRTGNSGSSTGTHLHFQLMDRPSALVADGLPFVIDAFTLTGRSPTLEQLMKLNPSTDPVPVDPAGAGERTNQLPMSRDVVSFTRK